MYDAEGYQEWDGGEGQGEGQEEEQGEGQGEEQGEGQVDGREPTPGANTGVDAEEVEGANQDVLPESVENTVENFTVCVCVRACVRACVVYVHVCMHMYLCYACVRVCMHLRVCVCVSVLMHWQPIDVPSECCAHFSLLSLQDIDSVPPSVPPAPISPPWLKPPISPSPLATHEAFQGQLNGQEHGVSTGNLLKRCLVFRASFRVRLHCMHM